MIYLLVLKKSDTIAIELLCKLFISIQTKLSYIWYSLIKRLTKMNLLSTNELAEKLNVHRITVVRMVNDGRIPHIKISDTEYRYDFEKVMTHLQANTTNHKAR